MLNTTVIIVMAIAGIVFLLAALVVAINRTETNPTATLPLVGAGMLCLGVMLVSLPTDLVPSSGIPTIGWMLLFAGLGLGLIGWPLASLAVNRSLRQQQDTNTPVNQPRHTTFIG